MITGFSLIHITSESVQDVRAFSEGSVGYSPKKKYKVEKQNPLKPWKYWRQGKYYADEFQCKIPVSPEEFQQILNYLNTVEMFDDVTGFGLHISYLQAGEEMSFPITKILSLPKRSDDLQEFPDFIKFSLESRYEHNPGLPVFFKYSEGVYGSGLYNW